MYPKQLSFLIILLTVYLGRVLFGEAIHLAECSFSHADAGVTHCCSHHSSSHQHSSPRTCNTPVEEQDTLPGSDSQNSQHDSDDCSVCLVLAQAHFKAARLEVSVSSEALPLFMCLSSVLYLPDGFAGFQTRAPPEFA
ncbi:MAG: DUF2946 family protein [Planctomycetaceae bacterium]